MKQHYQKMLAYTSWANAWFLDCMEKNTVANAKVFLLMSHILAAEEIWLCRLSGKPAPNKNLWKDMLLNQLIQKAREQAEEWEAFLEAFGTGSFDSAVEYQNTRGEAFFTSVADILNHVINHGTYHRGQIANLLKLEAVEPPLSDYIFYVRQLKNDSAGT